MTAVLLISIAYFILIISLGQLSQSNTKMSQWLSSSPVVYALSLGVYCTAWTFFGSIGLASSNGLGFLGVYIGPTLTAPLWILVWKKMIRISRMQRITSVADFVSARYGKSSALGVLISIFCLVVTIPYISIQLKALDFAVVLLSDNQYNGLSDRLPFYQNISLGFTLFIIAIAIYFGTRKIDPTESHPSIVHITALGSIVKLVCFLTGALAIIYGIFDGFDDIFQQAYKQLDMKSMTILDHGGLDAQSWFWITLLSASAFTFLPRQFHMAIIENTSVSHIPKASWLTPLYLLLISVLVLPVAIGGKLIMDSSVEPDTYLLNMLIIKDYFPIALIVFVGGLAAISGMIIVSIMSLSVMMSNNIFLPLLLRVKTQFDYFRVDLNSRLLQIRKVLIVLIIFLSFGFYRLFSINYSIVAVGLISFAGIVHIALLILLGIYWKHSTKRGAISGFLTGSIIWFFTLPFANLCQLDLINIDILDTGLFGMKWLRPTALFGLSGMPFIVHGAMWSLLFHLFVHVIVSLKSKRSPIEISQSDIFLNPEKYYKPDRPQSPMIKRSVDYNRLRQVFTDIMGERKYNEIITSYYMNHSSNPVTPIADNNLINYLESHLAGSIGSASANIVLNHIVEYQKVDANELLVLIDETYQVYEYSRQIEEKSEALKQMTSRLKKANDKLRELDLLKNEFISNVTHELRTPITSIRSLANTLLNYDISDEEREKFYNIINEESIRVSELINKVLDLRKIEDMPKLHIVSKNVEELVNEVVEAIRAIQPERIINVILNCEGLKIKSDCSKVKQILINLLSNAIKFTEVDLPIDLTITNVNELITFEVKDLGNGIPVQEQEKIFDRFYQINSEANHKNKGSGLGLHISRRLAESLDGTLEVYSKDHEGTKFILSIPYNISSS